MMRSTFSPAVHSLVPQTTTNTRRRSIRRFALTTVAASGLGLSSIIGAMAGFGGAEPVGGGTYDGGFTYGSYAVCAEDATYQYATGKDGNAYYNTYEGGAWSGWTGWDSQPYPVKGDAAPVAYGGSTYAFYSGTDDHIYGYSEADGWQDVSGDLTYASSPYATATDDALYLYATASDGYVYQRTYTAGTGWDAWTAVSATPGAGKPYAVSWGGYQNVFYNDTAGNTYWNRYDYAAGAWTGEKAIPATYGFAAAPYAVGYEPEASLYAYGVTTDGGPAYNVFDGSSWSGWQAQDVGWKAEVQPNAYVYEGTQQVVYTAKDGHAYYQSYGTDGWSGWEDLGGNYAYDSQQYLCGGPLSLTYTGLDGGVYTKKLLAGGGVPTQTPYVEPTATTYYEPTPTTYYEPTPTPYYEPTATAKPKY